MNRTVSHVLKYGLLSLGHYARQLRGVEFPGVAVLCYHGLRADDWRPRSMAFEGLNVRVSEFDSHCRLIHSTCHPISLAEWRAALNGGPPLPARPVLFTFDDGYRTVFTLAQPILERHGIPAVAFVCSDPVEQQRLLWYDAVARACGEIEVQRIKGLPYERWASLTAVFAQAPDEADPNAPLTAAELKMLADGWIEIGGHTAGHPVLARATREQQRDQIFRNKLSLEAWTGRPVKAFAYPDGLPGKDYSPETAKVVEECGFDFAFTTRQGFASPQEPALERSRFVMLDGISAAELAHRLTYSWRR